MKRRYHWYILASVSFGVFDLLYETHPFLGEPSFLRYLIRAWLVWLILVIPISIIETKAENDIERTILAGTLSAMIANKVPYWLVVLKSIFIGSKSANSYHIFNFQNNGYFKSIFLLLHNQFWNAFEWVLIALFSGAIVSYSFFSIYKQPIQPGRHEKKTS